MNGVGEVCAICFDAFEDPVMLSCGHKLCMKCLQSLTPVKIDLVQENKGYGNPFISIDSAKYGITCPYRCSTKQVFSEYRRPSLDYLAMYSPEICLRSFVICFLVDGSERYMEMTIRSINSLMMSTPIVFVGVLVPPDYDTSDLQSRVIDPTRVMFKEYRQHFDRWNPTQHKLDIAQFAAEFKIVFWLDSDTYVYRDLTPILMDFRISNTKFAFLADHVCTNQEFLGNWKHKNTFIPQACFMGFRREYINSFFSLWEELWRSWIEPFPFHNHPDPLPSFSGSAFCTEQYALGMAIEKFGLARSDIFELRRVCIPLGIELSPDQIHSPNPPTSPSDSPNNNSLRLENNTKVVTGLSQTFWEHMFIQSSYGVRSSMPTTTPPNTTTTVTTTAPTSSYNSSYHPSSAPSSYLFGPTALWIDDIEGHILHFYSLHYEITYAWFTNHRDSILKSLEEYWAPLDGPPPFSL